MRVDDALIERIPHCIHQTCDALNRPKAFCALKEVGLQPVVGFLRGNGQYFSDV